METHPELTPEAVAVLPPDALIRAWLQLTHAVREIAVESVDRLVGADVLEAPRTVDEKSEQLSDIQRNLESAANLSQEVARTADAVLHIIAVEHQRVVEARDHLDSQNYGLCERPPLAGEFAGDALGMALGVSSAAAGRLASDGELLVEEAPQLLHLAARGLCRTSVAVALAREVTHLEGDEASDVINRLVENGAHRLGVDGARGRARRLLRGLGLSRPEVEEVDPRRECGVWFSPHLEFDNLTEVRMVIETKDAARLHAAIEERARVLAEYAPDPRDELERLRTPERFHPGDAIGAIRVDALLDLVFANATVNTVLHLKVPVHADALNEIPRRRGMAAVNNSLHGQSFAATPQGGIGVVGETRLSGGSLGAAHVRGFGIIPAIVVERISALLDTSFTLELADANWTTVATRGKSYRPSAGIAALVRNRDECCRFPNCAVPSERCDLDHVIAHAEGGATTAANLQALCRHHHRAKTFGGFAVVMDVDGTCTWESPTGARWVTLPGGRTQPVELCATG